MRIFFRKRFKGQLFRQWKALKELKEDGTLTEISKKWYGQDAAPEDDKFEETIN